MLLPPVASLFIALQEVETVEHTIEMSPKICNFLMQIEGDGTFVAFETMGVCGHHKQLAEVRRCKLQAMSKHDLFPTAMV